MFAVFAHRHPGGSAENSKKSKGTTKLATSMYVSSKEGLSHIEHVVG